jgi:hypothetical protein
MIDFCYTKCPSEKLEFLRRIRVEASRQDFLQVKEQRRYLLSPLPERVCAHVSMAILGIGYVFWSKAVQAKSSVFLPNKQKGATSTPPAKATGRKVENRIPQSKLLFPTIVTEIEEAQHHEGKCATIQACRSPALEAMLPCNSNYKKFEEVNPKDSYPRTSPFRTRFWKSRIERPCICPIVEHSRLDTRGILLNKK